MFSTRYAYNRGMGNTAHTNTEETVMKTVLANEMSVQVITVEEWDVVSEERKKQNAKKHNRSTHGTEPCKLCGQTISDKALDNSWWVHMTTSGDLYPVAFEITQGSQGYFPIGAACAKRIPKEYKVKTKGMF